MHNITSETASMLVGGFFIIAIGFRGLLAPLFDKTSKGARPGHVKPDLRGLYAAAAALIALAPFVYWAAPKLATSMVSNNAFPPDVLTIIGYTLAAMSAVSTSFGLYTRYASQEQFTYGYYSTGARTVKSICYTTVGAFAGCLAASLLSA